MLFFLTWPDRYSLLLDVANDDEARRAANEIAGVAPSTCVAVPPGVFAAEVFLDEDEDGAELLVVEPLEHAAAALLALEEQGEDSADVDLARARIEDDAPPVVVPLVPPDDERCGFELEDDEKAVLRCERRHHDDAEHYAHDARGGLVEWADEGDG